MPAVAGSNGGPSPPFARCLPEAIFRYSFRAACSNTGPVKLRTGRARVCRIRVNTIRTVSRSTCHVVGVNDPRAKIFLITAISRRDFVPFSNNVRSSIVREPTGTIVAIRGERLMVTGSEKQNEICIYLESSKLKSQTDRLEMIIAQLLVLFRDHEVIFLFSINETYQITYGRR